MFKLTIRFIGHKGHYGNLQNSVTKVFNFLVMSHIAFTLTERPLSTLVDVDKALIKRFKAGNKSKSYV